MLAISQQPDCFLRKSAFCFSVILIESRFERRHSYFLHHILTIITTLLLELHCLQAVLDM